MTDRRRHPPVTVGRDLLSRIIASLRTQSAFTPRPPSKVSLAPTPKGKRGHGPNLTMDPRDTLPHAKLKYVPGPIPTRFKEGAKLDPTQVRDLRGAEETPQFRAELKKRPRWWKDSQGEWRYEVHPPAGTKMPRREPPIRTLDPAAWRKYQEPNGSIYVGEDSPVPRSIIESLIAMGWRGRPGDRREVLYPPDD